MIKGTREDLAFLKSHNAPKNANRVVLPHIGRLKGERHKISFSMYFVQSLFSISSAMRTRTSTKTVPTSLTISDQKFIMLSPFCAAALQNTMVIMIVMVRNNKMLTSRHKKAPESFDSEALDHDYYIWVKNGNLRKLKRGIYHKKL